MHSDRPGPLRPLRRTYSTLALVGASLLFASSLRADQPVVGELFVDRVDVNVINVEVFVTDRDGKRASGLDVDDFEIFVDGEPRAITNFFAVDRRGYPGEPAAEMMLPGGTTRHRLHSLPIEQRLQLLVYIDDYNLRPASRNRLLRQMEAFVDRRLENGDQMMLVRFDRRLDVLTPFTTDREQIERAIRELSRKSGYRALIEAERKSLLRDIEQYALGPAEDRAAGYRQAIDAVRVFEQKLQEDFAQSARGLRQASHILAGLPGRKALLHVSDGLTMLPGQELYEHVARVFGEVLGVPPSTLERPGELGDELRFNEFEQVIADANANQVTLYTLDARGNFGPESLSAEYATFGGAGGGMGDLDAIRQANLVAPLIHLAERTGGISIRNTNDLDGGLARLGQDFESFYSLGFQSFREADGKAHRIEVRVRHAGLDVRHRKAYVDKPREERMADHTFSSLFIEDQANPLRIHVDFGSPERLRRNRWVVPLIVRIPASHVTFLPQDDQVYGQLRLFVAARDLDSGGLSTVGDLVFQPSFSQGELERFLATGEVALRTNLQLSTGSPRLAVGVLDELSGVHAFTQQRIALEPILASRD